MQEWYFFQPVLWRLHLVRKTSGDQWTTFSCKCSSLVSPWNVSTIKHYHNTEACQLATVLSYATPRLIVMTTVHKHNKQHTSLSSRQESKSRELVWRDERCKCKKKAGWLVSGAQRVMWSISHWTVLTAPGSFSLAYNLGCQGWSLALQSSMFSWIHRTFTYVEACYQNTLKANGTDQKYGMLDANRKIWWLFKINVREHLSLL